MPQLATSRPLAPSRRRWRQLSGRRSHGRSKSIEEGFPGESIAHVMAGGGDLGKRRISGWAIRLELRGLEGQLARRIRAEDAACQWRGRLMMLRG